MPRGIPIKGIHSSKQRKKIKKTVQQIIKIEKNRFDGSQLINYFYRKPILNRHLRMHLFKDIIINGSLFISVPDSETKKDFKRITSLTF